MSDDLFWPPLRQDGAPTPDPDEPVVPGFPVERGEQPTTPFEMAPTASDAQPTRPRKLGLVAVAGVTAFVFGAGGVAVGAAFVDHDNSGTTTPVNSAADSTVSPSALTTTPKNYAQIAAKVLPSVVSINVTGSSESDTGSGVVLDSKGYILTNNHVVAAAVGGGSVTVDFNDGSTVSARIVGTDSLDDLAVIKVTKSGLTPAALGNSSDLQVGDSVLAIGSPLGLTGTVTSGIVSALNRPVVTQEEAPQQTSPFFGGGTTTPSTSQPTVIDAIQTDAAINPGNSGGALVNGIGQVIGINSAIASLGESTGSQSGNIGVGFAIPINQAKAIANELITTGHAVHPLLGVSLPGDSSTGATPKATVESVTPGGPAAKAGIKKGDVITAVDGVETQSADAVIAAIRSHQPGQKVIVTIQRDGSTKTVTATLTAQSSSQG
ncbi:MAG TPA: trypsin-like peptidase domain-containing protein [Mycobacteriales bacterium]|nr:trypsin-like peptidase domain-containing protein [Mycobacteriales bacterium]